MNYAKFNKVINDYIVQEEQYIKEHEEVKAILKEVEGKPINAQVLNKKRLGDFRLDTRYGMYHIEGKNSHLIGYQNSKENTIQIEKTESHRGFIYLDACNGIGAQERIKQLNALNKQEAFKLFNAIDKHFNKLRVLFGDVERKNLGGFHFPAYYSVLENIFNDKDNNNNINTSIQLHNFYFIRK